ncbi:MAG: glycosyltransferase family 4 protein [Terriglobales bacterium]
MTEMLQSETARPEPAEAGAVPRLAPPAQSQVALLTGGFDRPYAFGLAMALVAQGVALDVVGSDAVDSPEMHCTPGLTFLNLKPSPPPNARRIAKGLEILRYYLRLIRYAASAQPEIFHILWNSKFQVFDRTLLMLYYRILGKKIVLTAHNVNSGKRDGNDSWLNRLTLRIQYRLTDRIFVHTQKMKAELVADFGVPEHAVIVIRYPSDNAFPDTDLTPAEARQRLAIGAHERVLLFFGSIRPYKGVEYLLQALERVAPAEKDLRLIVAGEPMGPAFYVEKVRTMIAASRSPGKIIERMEFIPDDETEVYFKAADVLVLPYTEIFQSGVLFLAYAFGLPVIAADVGSLKEDIVEGKTGMVCRPRDPGDLASTIERYFATDLFRNLSTRRQEIKDHAQTWHSWTTAGEITSNLYRDLRNAMAAGKAV